MSTVNFPKVEGGHSHHFESSEHEYTTAKQGTEVLMFGGLFVGYAIFHHIYPEIFKIGSKFTDWRLGAANTVVLLTSSLTMALGIYYTQTGKLKAAWNNLLITVICGAIFMGIKYIEYSHKIHLGLLPGAWFSAEMAAVAQYTGVAVESIPSNLPMYFGFYYMMTGLHGLHVLFGMGAIIWVMIRMKKGHFGPKHYTAVEGVGLFWHLIDLVWIYLFPLLYLVT
jgi:cytochrome c oxidase subunit III